MLPQDSDRLESQPQQDQSPADFQNEETILEQDNRPHPLENVLELEEDWKKGSLQMVM